MITAKKNVENKTDWSLKFHCNNVKTGHLLNLKRI